MHPRQSPCRSRQRRTTKNSISNQSIIAGAVLLLIATLQQHPTSAFHTRLPTLINSPPSLKTSSNDRLTNHHYHHHHHHVKSTSSLSMVAKSGGRLILSTEQFEQEVLLSESDENQLPVLVLFSAPWCGPCRLTNPVVKEVMKQYQTKIEVVEISTDDLPEVAADAGVLSIPTILIYYGGEVRDTIVGCVAKNVLARSVDKVLEDLGMLDEE
mmetsp:Transcript_18704/g.33551  ORF Transcript_18704/g.33551 Transcript_18704/m.33551 type:complete len:212 (-) Transcript_18704:221-856(-)